MFDDCDRWKHSYLIPMLKRFVVFNPFMLTDERFKTSNLIPNEWFLKLREMNNTFPKIKIHTSATWIITNGIIIHFQISMAYYCLITIKTNRVFHISISLCFEYLNSAYLKVSYVVERHLHVSLYKVDIKTMYTTFTFQ